MTFGQAGSRSWASRPSPASGPRTRSSSPPFAVGGTRGWILGLATLIGAGITAFYMSRLFMTFHGRQKRWTDRQHPHESPATMTVPMIVLDQVRSAGMILALAGFFARVAAPGRLASEHEEHNELGRSWRSPCSSSLPACCWPTGATGARRCPPAPEGNLLTQGRTRGPLPGRHQRGPVQRAARHPPDAGSWSSPTPGSDATAGGLAATIGGFSLPPPAPPEQLRPLLVL